MSSTHLRASLWHAFGAATLAGFMALAAPAYADDDDDDGGSNAPVSVTVSCGSWWSPTINAAIQEAPPHAPLLVRIKGVCEENVLVNRDAVTLRGVTGPATDGIRGVPETDPVRESPITILGAVDVVVENLTISNGGTSGIGLNNANAIIRNSTVVDNANSGIGGGIFVGAGSFATIDNVAVRDNPNGGVLVRRGGAAEVVNSLIEQNPDEGIDVADGGSILVGIDRLNVPGPNTVQNNGRNGIEISNGASGRIVDNAITGNGAAGFAILDGASARIGNNTVTGNGGVGLLFVRNGAGTVVDSTITGNGGDGVAITQASSVFLGGNTINGNSGFEVIVVDAGVARLQGNAVTDDSAGTGTGSALEVLRGASARLVGGNTLTQANAAGSATAVEVFHMANLRQDTAGGDVIGGPVALSLGNLATVDLRLNYTLNGKVDVFELATFRLRGPGTLNGDIEVFSPTASASSNGAATFNGTCTGNCSGL